MLTLALVLNLTSPQIAHAISDEAWQNLLLNRCLVQAIHPADVAECYTTIAGKNIDPKSP